MEALAWSNAKAIAATPRENIIDCLEKHKPLQGTASVPVGMRTAAGQVMGDYEEVDLMVESGYRRYPGLVSIFLVIRLWDDLEWRLIVLVGLFG